MSFLSKFFIITFFTVNLFASMSLQKEYLDLVDALQNERNHKVIVDSLYKFYSNASKHKDESFENLDVYTHLQIAFDEFYPVYNNDYYKYDDCGSFIRSIKISMNPKFQEDDNFGDILEPFFNLGYKACIQKKSK